MIMRKNLSNEILMGTNDKHEEQDDHHHVDDEKGIQRE